MRYMYVRWRIITAKSWLLDLPKSDIRDISVRTLRGTPDINHRLIVILIEQFDQLRALIAVSGHQPQTRRNG